MADTPLKGLMARLEAACSVLVLSIFLDGWVSLRIQSPIRSVNLGLTILFAICGVPIHEPYNDLVIQFLLLRCHFHKQHHKVSSNSYECSQNFILLANTHHTQNFILDRLISSHSLLFATVYPRFELNLSTIRRNFTEVLTMTLCWILNLHSRKEWRFSDFQ